MEISVARGHVTETRRATTEQRPTRQRNTTKDKWKIIFIVGKANERSIIIYLFIYVALPLYRSACDTVDIRAPAHCVDDDDDEGEMWKEMLFFLLRLCLCQVPLADARSFNNM